MEFINVAKEMKQINRSCKEGVGLVKVKKGETKEVMRIVEDVSTLIGELEMKYASIPQASKDTLAKYIPKVKKLYEEAHNFIEANITVGSIKKYDTSKNSKDALEKLKSDLKKARDTLQAVLSEPRLVIDPSLSSHPIPLSVGIEKHIESMHLAVQTESYIQALHLGRQILQKLPYDSSMTKAVINYNMACVYSKLYNTPNSVAHLQNARAFGFTDFKQLDQDHDFDNIRLQLEFMNFRQMMEYEVLQTERWREMSEEMVHRLTALFDIHDIEGDGSLTFSQFEILCKVAFQITSTAQVVAFWRETCEDTVEAMYLFEFLNFMAEHKDVRMLLSSDVAHSPRSSHSHSHSSQGYNYSGYAPIHTSSLFSPSSPTRNSPLFLSSSPPSSPQNTCLPAFSYSVEGQAWGCGDMARNNTGRAIQVSEYDSAPFSYYTTTDPFAKFRL